MAYWSEPQDVDNVKNFNKQEIQDEDTINMIMNGRKCQGWLGRYSHGVVNVAQIKTSRQTIFYLSKMVV